LVFRRAARLSLSLGMARSPHGWSWCGCGAKQGGEEYGEQYGDAGGVYDERDSAYLMGHGYDAYEIPPTPPHWSASASQFRWQLEYLQDPQRFMVSRPLE
jgi:hypothetical protein